MIEVALVVVASVIIVTASVRWSMTMGGRMRSADDGSGHGPHGPWFAEAGAVARLGLLAVDDLGRLIPDDTDATVDESTAAESIGQLDDLTHRLAVLATTAPTAMDGRVCRNAAVRIQSLVDDLRRRAGGPTAVRGPVASDRAEVAERRTECELALRDLAEHVLL